MAFINAGLVVGGSIPGGTADSILYLDASGNLAESNPGFTYDGTTFTQTHIKGGNYGDISTKITIDLQTNQYGPDSEIRHTTTDGTGDSFRLSNYNSDGSSYSYFSLNTDLFAYYIDLDELFGVTAGLFYTKVDLHVLADNKNIAMGAGGAADYYQTFDGTNAQFYTSGDFVFQSPLTVNSTLAPSSATIDIYQQADSQGVRIRGFDDMSAADIFLRIDNNGNGSIDCDNSMVFTASNGVVNFNCSSQINFKPGAGNRIRLLKNSDSVVKTQFWGDTGNIDTVGNITLDGDIGINTSTPIKAIQILQKNDTDGFRVNGFDDRSGSYGDFYVNSSGSYVVGSSNNMLFSSGAGNGIYLRAGSDGIRMNDNNAYDVQMVVGGGKVGVGTTIPTHKFTVVNGVNIGNLIPTYGSIITGGSGLHNAIVLTQGNSVMHISMQGTSGYGQLSTYNYDTSSALNFRFQANGGNLQLGIDNSLVQLGTARDMALSYDGTNGLIDTGIVAPSDLQVDCGTDKTIELQDTVWDDLRVPAQNTKLNPSRSEPAFESFRDGIFVFKFDTSNADDESIHFVAQMPHGYKEGTDIHPHIHWSPDSTNAGNVYWSFEYTVVNIDGAFGATTTDEITVAADGTQYKHQLDDFSVIDGTGLTISHIFLCRLTRRSSSQAADTFTGNACFLEFDFHYEIDTIGSRQETAK